jgi:hypothetical protein
MTIRYLSLTFCCLLFSLNALAEELLAHTYPIENVREVILSGGGTLELRQGDTETLRAEATKETLERVSVDLSGTRLTLKLKGNRKSWFDWMGKNRGDVKFIVQVKDLSKLELSGAAYGNIGKLQTTALTLNLHGAARADLGELRVSDLTVDVSGAGRMKVSEIYAQHLRANVSGAAQMEIAGAGSVDEMRLDVSGASKFFGKGVASVNAHASASGASHIELRASESLEAHASGASHINYFGNPRTKHHSSGASRIHSQGD